MLKAWIGPPLSPEAITVAYDPLRSRARFLEALTPAQRQRWFKAAEAALLQVAAQVRVWHASYAGKAFAAILTRHGELDVAARRQWLADVRGSRARNS